MKKIAYIAIMVLFGLAGMQTQAQTDTASYHSSWLWFGKDTGHKESFRKDSIVYGHDDTTYAPDSIYFTIEYVVDSVKYFKGNQDEFMGALDIFSYNVIMCPFVDTVPHTVYGVAIPANVYCIDSSSHIKEFKDSKYTNNCTRTPDGCEGDSGFWALLLTRSDSVVEGAKYGPCDWFDMVESVRLGPKHFSEDMSDLIGSTGRIRRSHFLFEYDTTEPEMFRYDTTGMFEFYFNTPRTYAAGDTCFTGRKHLLMSGYRLAEYTIIPQLAAAKKIGFPKLYYFGYFQNKCIGIGPDGQNEYIKHYGSNYYGPYQLLTKWEATTRILHPTFFPIVELRCSTPRDWTLAKEADSALLTWQHFDGAEGYELLVNNVTRKDSTVLVLNPDATQHTLLGVDTNEYYRIRLRKLCRYATDSYDTIVRSEWTETFTFGTPPPPDTSSTDTTTVDTNIVDTTSIRLATGLELELQPNPASGEVLLTMDAPEGGLLTLTDLAGREVLQQPIPAPTATLRLDISGLPAGSYMVKVTTPRGSATRRLLVQ